MNEEENRRIESFRMTIYFCGNNGKKEMSLDSAQRWLMGNYDWCAHSLHSKSMFWTHEFRLRRLNRKLRGITAEELWETLPEEKQKELYEEAEKWRDKYKRMYYEARAATQAACERLGIG